MNDGVSLSIRDGRLYQMKVGDEEKWLPLQQAGAVYDSGWMKVEIGGKVREPDGLERDITAAERDTIRDIADRVSASK